MRAADELAFRAAQILPSHLRSSSVDRGSDFLRDDPRAIPCAASHPNAGH